MKHSSCPKWFSALSAFHSGRNLTQKTLIQLGEFVEVPAISDLQAQRLTGHGLHGLCLHHDRVVCRIKLLQGHHGFRA